MAPSFANVFLIAVLHCCHAYGINTERRESTFCQGQLGGAAVDMYVTGSCGKDSVKAVVVQLEAADLWGAITLLRVEARVLLVQTVGLEQWGSRGRTGGAAPGPRRPPARG